MRVCKSIIYIWHRQVVESRAGKSAVLLLKHKIKLKICTVIENENSHPFNKQTQPKLSHTKNLKDGGVQYGNASLLEREWDCVLDGGRRHFHLVFVDYY